MVPKYIKENANDVVFNLEYNAERPHLIIPEYGRHLQKLIDQAKVIADREERNKAARYIIQVMGSLNPHLRDVPDFQHKLWDQIFIMADFMLDVDSPYPIPKYRFYGNNIKYMIEVANKWEEGEMKSALVKVIANHMKKSYLSWNKDTVTDTVIFEHLYELSEGTIDLLGSEEELSTTNDLIRTNKKVSNKTLAPAQKNMKIQGFKKPALGKKPFVQNNNNNNNPK